MDSTKQIDISAFRHLYPFRSRYLDLNGLKYHYLDEGSGDPVVMIHGNPTWSFYYRELIKALARQYRAIVPDHIGCGLSDKPASSKYGYRLQNRVDDLAAFLNHLGLQKKITLVLHDWGGMIGMAYALKHLAKIRRLIILNTAAFFPPKAKALPMRLRLVRDVKPIAIPAVQGLNLFVLGALFMAARKKLPCDVQTGLTAPYNSWNNRLAVLKFVQDIPVNTNDPSFALVEYVDRNLYKLADCPMLICWGKHDFVFDTDYFDEWRRRFPNAEAHLFSNAGHYVLEDVPDEIVPRVRDFLIRHPL